MVAAPSGDVPPEGHDGRQSDAFVRILEERGQSRRRGLSLGPGLRQCIRRRDARGGVGVFENGR